MSQYFRKKKKAYTFGAQQAKINECNKITFYLKAPFNQSSKPYKQLNKPITVSLITLEREHTT